MVDYGLWAGALLCVFVSAAMAVGAGIGGGSLFVASFMIFLSYDAHAAVPLSKATIFGLALAAYAVNMRKRHPIAKHRPLIDYDVALMLEPMTLLGTVVGVLLNVILVEYLILFPLCVVLGISSYETLKKAIKLHKKEQQIAQEAMATPLVNNDEPAAEAGNDQQLAAESSTDDNVTVMDMESTASGQHREDQLQKLRQREGRLVPWERLLALALVWLGYFVITFLLYRAHDVVKPCSGGWIVLFLSGIPYVGLIHWAISRVLQKKTNLKRALDYDFVEGDVQWDGHTSIKWPLWAFCAGVVASMMGVGGGLLKTPLMLSMNMLPQVVSTTSSFMIIFTSAASTIQYYILGKLRGDELAVVFVTGAAGAAIGQTIVNRLVAKSGKQSLVVFLLAGLTAISVVAIVGTSLSNPHWHDRVFDTEALCGS